MGLDKTRPLGKYSHRLPMGLTNQPPDLLHVLQVGESSLYPALQRLMLNGWVKAEWGTSENNRRARYYTLTTGGRKRLTAERQEFDQIVSAILKVLHST